MSLVQGQPSAGLRLDSQLERPDRVPLKKGEYSVASRALALSTYFLSGALAINLSQFLGTPLYLVNQDWYNAWIAFTKQSFGLLTMTLTQAFAPTKVVVSGDASVRGQLRVSAEGNLILAFPQRIVLIANHQIYTDWLYLWWVAYCNGMHGRLYIILKESLRRIPILGWGMQMSQFIFLKRNWEKDKPHMASALQKLNKMTEPMWLMLFPEGTNLAPSTREKSAAWAQKNGVKDMIHTLLPRTTGLQFCLQELLGTVDYLYDCTVAYEGVPRGQFAQDIFTLKAGYLEGRPPKSVHMYWRRYAIKDIPIHNDKAFELWLVARWREKDLLIENYLRTGNFPADRGVTKLKSGQVVRGTGLSQVQIRSSHWYEFLQIFAPMGVLAMILAVFYGALPKSFWNNFNKQALKANTQDIKKASFQAGTQVKAAANTASGLTLDDIFDKDKQEDSFKKGALAVQQWLGTPEAQKTMNRVDFVTQFLQNPEQAVAGTLKGQQKDFMHAIKQEEERRERLKLPHSAQNVGVQKGTFWKDLERLDKSRHGSVVSAPSSKPVGSFYADLQAAEQRKSQGLQWGARGNFYDKMKTEENSRYGTVRTLSSSNSSRGGTVRTLPSTPASSTRAPSIAPAAAQRKLAATGGTSPHVSKPASLPSRPSVSRAPSTVGSVASSAPKKLPTKPPATATTAKTKSSTAPKVVSKPVKPPQKPTAKSSTATSQPNPAKTSVSKNAAGGPTKQLPATKPTGNKLTRPQKQLGPSTAQKSASTSTSTSTATAKKASAGGTTKGIAQPTKKPPVANPKSQPAQKPPVKQNVQNAAKSTTSSKKSKPG